MDAADRVEVGYVARAHGVRGGVLVSGVADDLTWFAPGSVLVGMPRSGTIRRDLTIRATNAHNHGIVVYFAEVDDRDAAESLKGTALTAERSRRRDLGPDEYWPDQLRGLAAVGVDGGELGVVTDVVVGGPQDRLVVTTTAGAEVDVPFVAAIVTAVLPDRVVIDAPPGLFD